MQELEVIHIPAGDYVSKLNAAKFIGIDRDSLQGHIAKGHIETVRCPSGCHMIEKSVLLEFAATRRRPGRPSIYKYI